MRTRTLLPLSYEEMITTYLTVPTAGNKHEQHHRASCASYGGTLLTKLVQLLPVLGPKQNWFSQPRKRWEIHVLFSVAHRGASKCGRSTVGNQAETEEKMGGAALPISSRRSTPDQPIWIPPPVPSSLLPAPLASTVTVDHPTVPTYLT